MNNSFEFEDYQNKCLKIQENQIIYVNKYFLICNEIIKKITIKINNYNKFEHYNKLEYNNICKNVNKLCDMIKDCFSFSLEMLFIEEKNINETKHKIDCVNDEILNIDLYVNKIESQQKNTFN
jgi:hypothetical protein